MRPGSPAERTFPASADEDAFTAHSGSDAMAKAVPTLGPLIAESELILGEQVLASGLPG